MVKDRRERSASTTQSFSARIGWICFFGGFPTCAVISWDDYEGRPNQRQIVAWDEIEFVSDMGRGRRSRRVTDRYKPEDNRSEKSSVKSGRKGKKLEDRKEKNMGRGMTKNQARVQVGRKGSTKSAFC